MDTPKQTMKRESATARVIRALMEGRVLSVFDSKEFRLAEMHTAFCRIRKKVLRGKITGVQMHDKQCETSDGIRYKVYWFTHVSDGE